eukprot:6966948-Pyramimonas_sp.AAC.1
MQHGGGDIRGVVFADSSFNNVDDITFGELGEKLRSQLGCVRLLTDDGLYVRGAPLGAEARGLAEGTEALEWIRALHYE